MRKWFVGQEIAQFTLPIKTILSINQDRAKVVHLHYPYTHLVISLGFHCIFNGHYQANKIGCILFRTELVLSLNILSTLWQKEQAAGWRLKLHSSFSMLSM